MQEIVPIRGPSGILKADLTKPLTPPILDLVMIPRTEPISGRPFFPSIPAKEDV
jgi:hypothetical protein